MSTQGTHNSQQFTSLKVAKVFLVGLRPLLCADIHSKDLPLNLGLREDFLEFGFLGSFLFF